MALPGVSLVRTQFKEFIRGDIHMLGITVKKTKNMPLGEHA